MMLPRVLFICTHNRCRSILAEAICRHHASHLFEVASAGSQAVAEVHPLTLKYLKERGISTDALHSKSWDKFRDFGASAIVTMCDQAANEACPVWLNTDNMAHWGLADPSSVSDSTEQVAAAFHRTIDTIERRIIGLVEAKSSHLEVDQLPILFNRLADDIV